MNPIWRDRRLKTERTGIECPTEDAQSDRLDTSVIVFDENSFRAGSKQRHKARSSVLEKVSQFETVKDTIPTISVFNPYVLGLEAFVADSDKSLHILVQFARLRPRVTLRHSSSLPAKTFPAFLLPRFSILSFAKIDAKLLCDSRKRQLRIVEGVVAKNCEHFDLFESKVRGSRLESRRHSQIVLPADFQLKEDRGMEVYAADGQASVKCGQVLLQTPYSPASTA